MPVSEVRRLRRGVVNALVDPARGGELTSIRLSGHEVLSTMPWARTGPPERVDPDETEFTWAWGGGWQLAFPNAGRVSELRGRRFGFHGGASWQPWAVAEEAASSILLQWSSAGLGVRRRITLLDDGLHVSTEVTAAEDEPEAFIAVEHLVLGSAVTEGGYRLELPSTEVVDLYHPKRSRWSWPGPAGRGPSAARWDHVGAGEALSRFGAAGPLGVGAVRVLPNGSAPPLDVRWDSSMLPFLWIWQERDGDLSPPWNGCTRALGIEPSMVPDDDGIGAAAARGHVAVLRPGEQRTWWISLRVVADTARAN